MQPSQERQPARTDRLPRRRTDRLEDAAAWVLTAAALFVLLAGVLGGWLSAATRSTPGRLLKRNARPWALCW